MRLDLNPREVAVLAALLDAAHRQRLHELHHTDSRDYRERLRREVDVIEDLSARLAAEPVVP
jgi:hypothetical protein